MKNCDMAQQQFFPSEEKTPLGITLVQKKINPLKSHTIRIFASHVEAIHYSQPRTKGKKHKKRCLKLTSKERIHVQT